MIARGLVIFLCGMATAFGLTWVLANVLQSVAGM